MSFSEGSCEPITTGYFDVEDYAYTDHPKTLTTPVRGKEVEEGKGTSLDGEDLIGAHDIGEPYEDGTFKWGRFPGFIMQEAPKKNLQLSTDENVLSSPPFCDCVPVK